MMVMIGGAGVVGGAIAGGFILGMLEAVGLTVLHAYGDITYLVIFATLMVFLAIRPERADGQAVGLSDAHRPAARRLRCSSRSLMLVVVPLVIDATGRNDLYYTLTLISLLAVASAGRVDHLLHRPHQYRAGGLRADRRLRLGDPRHRLWRVVLVDDPGWPGCSRPSSASSSACRSCGCAASTSPW